MAYKIGDEFFYTNARTGEVRRVEITDIKYTFDRRVLNTNNLYESQINGLLTTGELSRDVNVLKAAKIAKLEEELGIKLKEV